MKRLLALGVATGLLAFAVGTVSAVGPGAPWDGANPFVCELQQLGEGVDFKDPEADPFCVEYDKRRQNVSEAGVISFLSLEPARVAAAGPKCWYFQSDHWRGSIVQDDASTKTYEWDGHYFFDKARGLGGVYVENFTVNGQTGDPREIPGFPEEWKPYFGPGKGGYISADTFHADPNCIEKAKQDVAGEQSAGGPYKCTDQNGPVGRGIGPLRLGATREDAESKLGKPARTSGALLRWCTIDGGKLAGGYRKKKLEFAFTTSPQFDAAGVRVGERKRPKGARRIMRRGSVSVLAVKTRSRMLLVGVDRKGVRFLAVAGPRVSTRTIRGWLDRSR